MRYLYLLLMILPALPAKLSAQDANYWASSYGPAGYFMPGAVISQNRDSGVMFYNPALLVNTEGSTTSISGTIYQWQSILYKNGLGTGLNLKSQGTSIIPMVASRAVPMIKRKLPFTLAFAIVHTPIIDYGVSQQKDVVQDVLDNSYSPGPETFIGQYKAANRMDQTAVQLGAGWRAGKKISLGFTAEAIMQKQTFTIDYIARALMNPAGPDTLLAPITTVSEDYTATYWQAGLRARLGLAWEISANHHAGLLITTPTVKVAGKGTVISNVQISNLYLDPTIALNLLASSRQAKLPSHWKNPLSIAAGYTYIHKKGQLYFAAEYFAPVKEYSVLKPKPAAFIRPDTGNNNTSSEFLQLNDARRALVNFGIGASYQLAGDFVAFASLRTDFTYDKGDIHSVTEGYNINVTNWNLYHAQIGVNMRRKWYHLRTGLMLTYGGTNNYPQTFNLDKPDESNFLLGEPGVTKAHTFQAGVLVSYIHNF
ncbi:hypothetical protein [Chitinophaga barathri]|uniref:Long-chain fatty acid transporter n=1 Tax=Chitinophaga barathri TaxID=1647451 RepID=A0A3N4MI45_9BACT|nr:hypothetical protein [Chitinophaga barathri]RPD43278.1 hypothetical protein EG028_02990 [Chitinophaga barathri]